MKGFGLLLILFGVVISAFGIYGFITLSSNELPGGYTDWAIDTFNALGGGSALTASQSFQLALVRNRVLLSVAGAAGIVIGAVLRKKSAS
jgi:hypothetical protein